MIASPLEARRRIREGRVAPFAPTSGMAMGYLQANLAVVPVDQAGDFEAFCRRNPKPCPLLAISMAGSPHLPALGAELDVRTDLPGYRVWQNGELVGEVTDVVDTWRPDLVAFALGCSFSFEDALVRNGIEVRHLSEECCVPMYRTNLPLVPAGRFRGTMVVSMRPMSPPDAKTAAEITSRFPMAHGGPIHSGDPARIGIADLARPDFGDAVTIRPGEISVFWACGVTPQNVLVNARPEFAITHVPGCMLISDIPSRDDAPMVGS